MHHDYPSPFVKNCIVVTSIYPSVEFIGELYECFCLNYPRLEDNFHKIYGSCTSGLLSALYELMSTVGVRYGTI